MSPASGSACQWCISSIRLSQRAVLRSAFLASTQVISVPRASKKPTGASWAPGSPGVKGVQENSPKGNGRPRVTGASIRIQASTGVWRVFISHRIWKKRLNNEFNKDTGQRPCFAMTGISAAVNFNIQAGQSRVELRGSSVFLPFRGVVDGKNGIKAPRQPM